MATSSINGSFENTNFPNCVFVLIEEDNILMISDLNKVKYFRDTLKESQANLIESLEKCSLEDSELYHNSIMVIKSMASNFISELLKCQKEKNVKLGSEKENLFNQLNTVLERIDRLIVDIIKCKETLDNISKLFGQGYGKDELDD